jgi:hypothetical protein
MKEKNEHNDKDSFLKKGEEQSRTKLHKEYLGADIPKDYFAKSKLSIMDAIANLEDEEVLITKKETKVVRLNSRIIYGVAASLVFLLSLTVWLQNSKPVSNSLDSDFKGIELFSSAEDVLINSLFVEDSEMELYANNVLVNEVLIKAELSEQKLEEVLINSLFVEDSLIDNYTSKSLIENLIL